MKIVLYQEELSPALSTVIANVGYQELRRTVPRIDEVLERRGAQRQLLKEGIPACRQTAEENSRTAESMSPGELAGAAHQACQALRCNVARELLGEIRRGFTARLADSPLLQRFSGIARSDVIQEPSKSTVDRHGKPVDEQTEGIRSCPIVAIE